MISLLGESQDERKRQHRDCEQELWRGLRRSYYLQRVMELTPFVVDWLVKRAQYDSEFAQIFMTKL